MKKPTPSDMRYYGKRVVGPVMLPFTVWIIEQAERKGIKKIYFLARDGYLLFEIARRICAYRKNGIECRYLYCSRQALRNPTYHLIGAEALELLTLGGYYATRKSVLRRAPISEGELNAILESLYIEKPDAPLSPKELEEFKSQLKGSNLYKTAVNEGSKKAYEATLGYLRQEGLFEDKTVAIADSGWTGSMQRSLRQLLESDGFNGRICGFYFGMYASGKEKKDGEYNTFYFDSISGAKRKATFNNNLFECMLSAPHPMTTGYAQRHKGEFYPVFAPDASGAQRKMIKAQIEGAIEYAEEKLAVMQPFVYKKEVKEVYRLLKRYTVYPTRRFAQTYGSFAFCDDVTEGYYIPLADLSQKKLLKKYMFIPRLMRKLFSLKAEASGELYWPYGVIALCPAPLRPWYRLNVRAWEILKAYLK